MPELRFLPWTFLVAGLITWIGTPETSFAAPGNEYLGRWELDLEYPDFRAAALIVEDAEGDQLQGRFIWRWGSIETIPPDGSLRIEDGDLIAITKRLEQPLRLRRDGDTVAGTLELKDGEKLRVTGKRGVERVELHGTWDLRIGDGADGLPGQLDIEPKGGGLRTGYRMVGSGGKEFVLSEVSVQGDRMSFTAIPPDRNGPSRSRKEQRLHGELHFQGDRVVGEVRLRNLQAEAKEEGAGLAVSGTRRRFWAKPIALVGDGCMDNWRPRKANLDFKWTCEDGVLTNARKDQDICTRRNFDDFKLHVEFKIPPGGNSGVYLRGRYELQISDDYGKPPSLHGTAAIYSFKAPLYNAVGPPGTWQTLDVTLVGRWLTAHLNGKLAIDNVHLDLITGGAEDSNESAPGPLLLQGDHGRVWFRNVVISPARSSTSSLEGPPPDGEEVEVALHRAIDFFSTKAAFEGAYAYAYSTDFAHQQGEGRGSSTAMTVQPPGTPSIGLAYLRAHQVTGDACYLTAAKETAEALLRGQLRSGGWGYRIEFDPESRASYAYRVEPQGKGQENTTVLDDNTSQTALRFLMQMDKFLKFQDERIHEAVEYSLAQLTRAQYPNGAWPQRFSDFPDPAAFPVKQASVPTTWPRVHPRTDYRRHYTFNDNTILDLVRVFLEAGETYDNEAYTQTAKKAGEFILLAQMPEPQPAWAQQYDASMHPTWARRFEPPAISGRESQDILKTLLVLYQKTGDQKFLTPVPVAINYLKSSVLPDGSIPRFRELGTNKPLYMTRQYKLTYDDSDMPTHYAFKVGNRLERIQREYEELKGLPREELRTGEPVPKTSPQLVASTRAALEDLDAQGRWVQRGRLRTGRREWLDEQDLIHSRTFVRNVGILCDYLEATKKSTPAE